MFVKMSEFNEGSLDTATNLAGFRDGSRVVTNDGEELIEVEVDEDEDLENDDSTVWGTEIDNNEEVTMEDEDGGVVGPDGA